ncbi:MAG: hypothetical protein OEV43_06740 [Coriobacteriia bacterium]|nr:hypothetical protein [Coriobacteriia bacterium]
MPVARRATLRNVTLSLLGAVVLVLKPLYHGPAEAVFYSYVGNISVSFALYFAALNATSSYRRPRVVAGLATLLAVEAFEATSGFGVMGNTYDSVDFVANALGIALAVAVDVMTSRMLVARGPDD